MEVRRFLILELYINRIHEPRAVGERGFANLSFSYIAPCLYNKLTITVKQIDSLNTLPTIS